MRYWGTLRYIEEVLNMWIRSHFVPMMVMPDTVKNDIIERVENRQARYEEFVMFPGISSGIELKNYS